MEDGEWALVLGGSVVALAVFGWIGTNVVGDSAHPIASGVAFVMAASLTILATLLAWGVSKSWKATGITAALALIITSTVVFPIVKDKFADNSPPSWGTPSFGTIPTMDPN